MVVAAAVVVVISTSHQIVKSVRFTPSNVSISDKYHCSVFF